MAAKPEPVREDEDDFLAFWAEHRAAQNQETKRILGVEVVVPTDIPLSFEDTLTELQNSEKREDFEHVLEILFGTDVLGRWKANGCTGQQLRVLMAWGMANAGGKPTTFAEAVELVGKAEELKAQAEAEGKAVPINRAARRASSKTAGSAGSGRSSKRTSRANTA